MKERFIENGIEYVRCGDYYIPNLKAPEGNYNIGTLFREKRDPRRGLFLVSQNKLD